MSSGGGASTSAAGVIGTRALGKPKSFPGQAAESTAWQFTFKAFAYGAHPKMNEVFDFARQEGADPCCQQRHVPRIQGRTARIKQTKSKYLTTRRRQGQQAWATSRDNYQGTPKGQQQRDNKGQQQQRDNTDAGKRDTGQKRTGKEETGNKELLKAGKKENNCTQRKTIRKAEFGRKARDATEMHKRSNMDATQK